MTTAAPVASSHPAPGTMSALQGRLPLIIGVTGHRDLRDEDIGELERRVGIVFDRITSDYLTGDGATRIVVLSALAEGADQLVARAALKRGALLVAPLPMPIEEYRKDFQPGLTVNAEGEFDRLLARAIAIREMPFVDGNTIETIRTDPARRALQYREAGFFIVRHCQILLALWDRDESDPRTGGTAEIVRLQREEAPLASAESVRDCIDGTKIAALITIMTPRRQSPPGSVTIASRPWGRELTAGCRPTLTTDRDLEAWRSFETWIRLTTAFNADAKRILSSDAGVTKIEQSLARLFDAPSAPVLAGSARAYASADAPLWCAIYGVADILAQKYRRRFTRVWALLFTLGFLVVPAMSYLMYAPPGKIYALIGLCSGLLIMCSIGLYLYARRRQFQQKFLDYRALSEAMRVAVFWKIARIDKPITEIYPVCQSPELAWIKNSLISLECFDSGKMSTSEPLADIRYRICRSLWVEGQLQYFTRRSKSHERTAARRNHWSIASFALMAIGAVAIAFADYFDFDWRSYFDFDWRPYFGFDWRPHVRFSALVPLAILLPALLAATLKAHAEQLGRTAQALQYDRMRSLYERTLRILPRSIDQLDSKVAREVFTELGREAMHETASWMSIFRLRPLRPFF
jgi:hypothetical protein